jgi:hypothetical protein
LRGKDDDKAIYACMYLPDFHGGEPGVEAALRKAMDDPARSDEVRRAATAALRVMRVLPE